MLIGSVISTPPIICSGITYLPLTTAEAMLVNAFRLITQQGDGNVYIEFKRDQHGRSICTRFDVQPNFGGAKAINAVLGITQFRE